jgi:hypothetical protein
VLAQEVRMDNFFDVQWDGLYVHIAGLGLVVRSTSSVSGTGHRSHLLTGQIYKKLNELGIGMKNMGYNPTTDVVLFDLEDEEKEHTLVPYSEKLAIAFGILSTRPGEAIRTVITSGFALTVTLLLNLYRG